MTELPVKTLADYEDQISAWHDDTTGVPLIARAVTLHEYLGLSWEQYRALVEVSPQKEEEPHD
jgi:hypothetical protein